MNYFLSSCINGDLEALRSGIASGFNVDETNGRCPLQIASEFGQIEAVRELLNANANVNYVNKRSGSTALIKASANGHAEIVGLLLEKRADVNVMPLSFNALMIACIEDHSQVVEKLIEAKADVNSVIERDGTTPLMLAAQYGKFKVVKKLIKKKADVSSIDYRGKSAMFFAKDHENIKGVLQKRLVKRLNLAAKEGKIELLSKLVAAGAEVNMSNALLIASRENKFPFVSKLLTLKADVNKSVERNFTSLMYAAKSGAKDVVQLLLAHRANPSIETSCGRKAISYTKSVEITRLLQQASDKADLLEPNGAEEVKCMHSC